MKKRINKHESDESSDRWLVSYADFITLMFAFFAVLYATSDVNIEKGKKFENSIKEHLIKFGAAGGSGHIVSQGVKENSVLDTPLPTFAKQSQKSKDTVEKAELLIEEKLGGDKNKLVQDVSVVDEGVRISLVGNKVFAKNSIKFLPSSLKDLDAIAFFLKDLDRRVHIESHIAKGLEYNPQFPTSWELGSARSNQFIKYLTKKIQFPEDKLIATSYGDQYPLFPEGDPNFSNNQRLDLIITTE